MGASQNHSDSIRKYLFIDNDKAAYWAKEFILKANQGTNTEEKAIANNLYGHIFANKAISDSALYYYYKSLAFCREGGHSSYTAHVLNSIAAIYLQQGMFEVALENFELSLKQFTLDNDKVWMANVQYNIANIQYSLNQLDKAFVSYKQTLASFSAMEDTLSMSYALLGIGQILYDQTKYTEAIDNYIQAISYGSNKDDLSTYALIHTKTGQAYIRLSQYQKAFTYLEKGLHCAKQSGNNRQLIEALEEMRLYYKHLNNGEQFIQLTSELDSLNLSVFKQEQVESLAKMNALHKVQQMTDKMEISQLEKQKAENKNFFLLILVGIMLLVIASLYFLFRRLHQQKTKIQEQKTDLESLLQEKDVLMKEIHHRVKNNLQVVSSLLSLQTAFKEEGDVSRPELKSAFMRINSMALVHKELYSGDDITTAPLYESVEQLTSQVLATFGEKMSVGVNINIDRSIKFETEKAIAIVLVLNELFTNSIKHNFLSKGSGQVFFDAQLSNDQLAIHYTDYSTDTKNREAIAWIDNNVKKGFGSKLIDIFCKKLRAKYSMDLSEDGIQFSMIFQHT